jgi:dye decolorizing peroxidase
MVSRRTFLTTSGLLASGVIGAVANEFVRGPSRVSETSIGDAQVEPTGVNQAGVELELQTLTRFIALDIKPGTDKSAMLRWMSLITDDITRLAAGQAALADPNEYGASNPARLTVTVGFGPSLFEKLGLTDAMPVGFGDLPSFKIDQLVEADSHGDVLLHVSGDDPLTLSHAARTLVRDSADFATVRWVHGGFTNSQGVERPGKTQRNLMGQVDGTDNPALGSEDFENLVWIKEGPAWAIGGTQLALRKIRMELDTWDSLSSTSREEVIGRRLSDGAPLGGNSETDPPNLSAVDAKGLKVIPSFAHIRRAAGESLDERFFRRPFNYEDVAGNGIESGMLWTAYAKNLEKQYLPVQKRLAEFDLLNKWTTPVASATFAIARGFKPGEIIAQELFA